MTSAIIIDNGSGLTKVGCTSDKAPRSVFPTIAAKENGKSIFGPDAAKTEGVSEIERLVKRGVVQNWEQMENMWSYCIHDVLKMDPTQHPVFLTEPPETKLDARIKTCEIVFEKFKAPTMFLGYAPVLSLYAYGLIEGFVIDSGYGTTIATPVVEGFYVPGSLRKIDLAGQDIDAEVAKILTSRGHKATTEAVNAVKENLCYVAEDYETEMKKTEAEVTKQYTLPDGQEISVGRERFECTELLFQTKDKTIYSLPKIAFDALQNSNDKKMFENIVLSGGTTMLEGMKARIEKELTKLLPNETIKIQASDYRNHVSFIGASILTAMDNFKPMWLTKEEFAEHGSSIIGEKMK